MKKIITVLSVFLISACVQVQHYYKPLINETIKKEVGEPLITDGWGVEYDCSYVTIEKEFEAEKISFFGGRHTIKIPEHSGFSKVKNSFNKDLYVAKTPLFISEYSKDGKFEKNINHKVGIVIPKKGPIYITPLTYNHILSPKGGNSSVVYNLKEEKCYDDTTSTQYFKRELIYNGGSGNVITIKYREYINDLARPAFTQDLTYDLSKSDIIGFKGARMRVLEADNTSIKYTVMKYFE